MSQIDYSSGDMPGGVRLNSGTRAPRTGIQESLTAPGIVPSIYHAREDHTAEAIARLSSQFGDVAEAYMRYKVVQGGKQIDVDKGLAARDARFDLPQLADQIDQNQLFPVPGESEADFAHRIVSQKTEGMSATYADEYARVVGPSLLTAVFQKKGQIRQSTVNEGLVLKGYELSVIDSPDKIPDIIGQAVDLGKLDNRDRDKVIVGLLEPAAHAAAKSGDITRTQWFADALQEYAPDKAAGLVEAAKAVQEKSHFEGLQEQINAAGRGEVPVDDVKQMIVLAEKDGTISHATYTTLTSQLGSRASSAEMSVSQKMNLDTLKTAISLGKISADQLTAELDRRVGLPRDNAEWIDPDSRRITISNYLSKSKDDSDDKAAEEFLKARGL